MSPVVIEQVRAEEGPDGKRAQVDWSGGDLDSAEAISEFGSDEDLAAVSIPARAAEPWCPVTPPPGEFELARKLSQRPYWPAGCHDNVEAAWIFLGPQIVSGSRRVSVRNWHPHAFQAGTPHRPGGSLGSPAASP